MLIDDFLKMKIAVHVQENDIGRLSEMEREIDTAVGFHLVSGAGYGFKQYCINQLDHVDRKSGIYVMLDNVATYTVATYCYMRAGSTYFQCTYGVEIVPLADVLDEIHGEDIHREDVFFDLFH